MAHVFRPTTVKKVPANATVVKVGGKRVAKWTARGGKAVVAELTEDGTRCRVRGSTYWIRYVDAQGVKRKVRGFKDRNATILEAAKLERQADDVRAGKEPAAKADGPAHMVDAIPEYRDHLARTCDSAKHVREAVDYVERILTGAGLTTPAAVDCEKLAGWLDRERRRVEPPLRMRPWSQRTYNHRVTKLKAFGNWLVSTGRAKYNPFMGLSGGNAEADRRHVRRVLDLDELAFLVATTLKSECTVSGLSGLDRGVLYTVASYTGLRVGSLSRLTPEAVEWDGDLPVQIYSRTNKNKKPIGVPLQPDVAAELAPWLLARPAGQPLWVGKKKWHDRSSEMLQKDLAAARAAWILEATTPAERAKRQASDTLRYRDAAGEVFDFHALRGQFISSLAKAGVSLSAAQKLAGHSDPKLTANFYTRWGKGELAAEVAKLPPLRVAR